tara:strand:- start:20509 stop:20814 length:306 start_codon:yes stop_codon:yes gene_type:complete
MYETDEIDVDDMSKISGAKFVIKRLGGLTRTARALAERTGTKVPVTTVQGWNERDVIPQQHWLPMIEIAKAMGMHLNVEDFIVDHDEDEVSFARQPEQVAS